MALELTTVIEAKRVVYFLKYTVIVLAGLTKTRKITLEITGTEAYQSSGN